MTAATAAEAGLTCDWAACDQPAAVDTGEWAFCDQHAAEEAHLDTDDLPDVGTITVTIPASVLTDDVLLLAAARTAAAAGDTASADDVRLLPLDALFVDFDYQRPLDVGRIDRMLADYDPALVGVLEVSDRTDGTYAIVDGQHRWALLRNVAAGEPAAARCRVHTGLTRDAEAALFYDIDTSRRQLSGWNRWCARRSAADPAVLEVEQTLASRGLRAGDKARPGEPVLRSTVAAEQLLELGGPELLGEVLDLVLAAWGPDPEALTRGILEGVGLLLTTYDAHALDLARLISKLQSLTPRQITARATGKRELMPGTQSRLTAVVMVELCNTGRSSRDRLDPNALRIAAKSRAGGNAPAGPKTRNCPGCSGLIVKKPGPGRWPASCTTCRASRGAKQAPPLSSEPCPAPVLDDMAIERACAGDRSVSLNKFERRVAVARFHARGLSDGEIGYRLNANSGAIRAHREHLGLVANAGTT